MFKFKPVYKNDYNKVTESSDGSNLRDSKVVNASEKSYLFKSSIINSNINNNAYTVISSRTRNENERFKNRLVTKDE